MVLMHAFRHRFEMDEISGNLGRESDELIVCATSERGGDALVGFIETAKVRIARMGVRGVGLYSKAGLRRSSAPW
ncbi:hypothetical protein [Sphingomonas sp. 3-13AW]|uniref:hypothetical protein n=1 Tax=Sphingomonas sp. 3-13AW TaxID=3050450 RepID=UPI003BB734B0